MSCWVTPPVRKICRWATCSGAAYERAIWVVWTTTVVFYLSGRLTRFAKVFGRRVNLDDIEEAVEGCFPCRAAAVEGGNRISLLLEPHDAIDPKLVRLYAARFLSERPHVVQVELVDRIPLTPSGKKDYPALISA